jgi:hypothetical protein
MRMLQAGAVVRMRLRFSCCLPLSRLRKMAGFDSRPFV